MTNKLLMDSLFSSLITLKSHMTVSQSTYHLIKQLLITHFRHSEFCSENTGPVYFGPFGNLDFPYRKMGAIDSIDLFGVDELLIFCFYLINRKRYKNTLDVGANIGLHSILMARCGYQVVSFEPDPIHQEIFVDNLRRNNITSVMLEKAAVSDINGEMEFIRVCGNTTGSHLSGSKKNLYGEVERFKVKTLELAPFAMKADFAKIDAEGHEVVLLKNIPKNHWGDLDVMVEVGTEENAEKIFSYFKGLGVSMFSQKIGWSLVSAKSEMPSSHKEGSLLISARNSPWS